MSNATRNSCQSLACSPPGSNAPAKLWTKVHQIFIRRRGVIDDKTHASKLRSSHPWWNGSAQPIFADSRQKSVSIATSLERSQKECRIDRAHPYNYAENLVKIDPVHSEINGLQGPLKRKMSTGGPLERKKHRHTFAFRHARGIT